MGIFDNKVAAHEIRLRRLEEQVAHLTSLIQAQDSELVLSPDFQQPGWLQTGSDDPPWVPEIRSAVAAGRTIEAIKLVRGYTNWGLAEAKAYVDQLDTLR